MLTTFRNLDDAKKRIIVAVSAVVLIALLFTVGYFLRGDGKDATTEAPLPYASETPTAVATAVPTVSTSASATPQPAPTGPGSSIVYGETSLSLEDQQAAQSIAKDGMITYFQNSKGENLESRNGRLDAFFTKESGAFDEGIGTGFGLPKQDANNYLISKGTIDYVDPAGGNTTEYKVVVGMTYKIQFNEENKTPQILEKNGVYTLLLSKSSGSWKIVSFNPNQ